MSDVPPSNPSSHQPAIEIVTFCYEPDAAEIEGERQRRQQLDAEQPCLNPHPATISELLAECERHRRRIIEGVRRGQKPFLPCTDANIVAILEGKEEKGFLLPPLERLFDAAVALDIGDAPPFTGEPSTGRDAVAALDSLIAWCKAKQQPADAGPASTDLQGKPSVIKNKRRGGRKALDSNSPKGNLYGLICSEHQPGERYAETAQRLKGRNDVEELAKEAKLLLRSTTIRSALEWQRQRKRRKQQTNKPESI